MSNSTAGPPMPPPPPGGDQDRGPALIAIWWTLSCICSAVLGLRFWTRIKMRVLGLDDWLMFITVLLFIETACTVTYYAVIGGGRHLYYLSFDQTVTVLEWADITHPGLIMANVTAKASISVLLLRLLGPNDKIRKWILYIVVALSFISHVLSIALTFGKCGLTPQANWNPTIPANCWREASNNYNYFAGAIAVLGDIILAIMPVTFITKLNMSLKKKIQLSVLLGLGLFTAAAALIRVYYLTTLTTRSDLTWDTFPLVCWTAAEATLLIVLGCVPTLKPLYDVYVKGKGFDGKYASHNYNQYGTSRALGASGAQSTWFSIRSKGRQNNVETLASTHSEGEIPLTDRKTGIMVTSAYTVDAGSDLKG